MIPIVPLQHYWIYTSVSGLCRSVIISSPMSLHYLFFLIGCIIIHVFAALNAAQSFFSSTFINSFFSLIENHIQNVKVYVADIEDRSTYQYYKYLFVKLKIERTNRNVSIASCIQMQSLYVGVLSLF